jgi:eukaryotic-like serine/threonine-protein kinase
VLVGAVLNQRYRLVALLGEGGLASVYRAEPTDGSAPVAVKLLKPEFRRDLEVVERFLAEAELAERIRHPAVVRVHASARAEDGTPYLVTELLKGYPLSVVMNHGPIPVERAVPMLSSLLDALAAAHQVGVVHRDLKPDNVFVDAVESTSVRLLDFGISRAVDAAGGSARKTKTGMLLGTPGYMSPEQVRNSKDADHRSDLFSAGVLFYELITGHRVFQGHNEYERMVAVLFTDVRPIGQVAPHFAHWDAFLAKALHRNVEARFQSAPEMRTALENVARQGRMPEPKFGGDATAVSPMAAQALVENEKPPDVRVVALPPRAVPLAWVLIIALIWFAMGLLCGFWVAVS